MSLVALLRFLPDKPYLSLLYYKHFQKFPNWKSPVTFNEKIQWLKLHDRNPRYTDLVDKVKVKEYIKSEIGEEYIIPTLKVWEKAEEIDISCLPDQFVLKCNHDSKSVIVCAQKKNFDINKAKTFMCSRLKNNGYWYGREWPYKNVRPLVFAEQYIDAADGDLKDYKVLCFNGKAKYIELHSNRFTGKQHAQDIYDTQWNKTNIFQGAHTDSSAPKPQNLALMLALSERLAQGMPHVRVDWYSVGEQLFFGEITFYDGSGFVGFDNPEHDVMFGNLINIDGV